MFLIALLFVYFDLVAFWSGVLLLSTFLIGLLILFACFPVTAGGAISQEEIERMKALR